MSVHSRSNWNLEVLVFKERGKLEYLEKNLSEERREPETNSTHIWRRCQDSNLGHTGGDECSHHCATLAPLVFSWVWMLHYAFILLRSISTVTQRVINFMHVFFRGYEYYVDFNIFSSALVSLLFVVNLWEIYMQSQWMLFCLVDGNCK